MSDKEIKLPIDTSLGKLPQKEKGSLLPVECKAQLRRRRRSQNSSPPPEPNSLPLPRVRHRVRIGDVSQHAGARSEQ